MTTSNETQTEQPRNPNAPDLSGLKQSAASIQEILDQRQMFIDILREELTQSREFLLNHKVALRQANKRIDALNEAIETGQKQLEDLEAKIKVGEAQIAELNEKYNGAIWYIGNMSRQTVDAQFVAEVHETYKAHQDQMRRKSNQREVEQVHMTEEQKKMAAKQDEADAHNLVARHQEGIKEPSIESAARPDSVDVAAAEQAKTAKEREEDLFKGDEGELPELEIEVTEASKSSTGGPSAPKPSLAAQANSHKGQSHGHRRKQKQGHTDKAS